MQSIGRVAIEVAKAQEKYVVLDADGLWLIQNEPHLVKDYKRAILTPNVVEFKRLCDSMVRHMKSLQLLNCHEFHLGCLLFQHRKSLRIPHRNSSRPS